MVNMVLVNTTELNFLTQLRLLDRWISPNYKKRQLKLFPSFWTLQTKWLKLSNEEELSFVVFCYFRKHEALLESGCATWNQHRKSPTRQCTVAKYSNIKSGYRRIIIHLYFRVSDWIFAHLFIVPDTSLINNRDLFWSFPVMCSRVYYTPYHHAINLLYYPHQSHSITWLTRKSYKPIPNCNHSHLRSIEVGTGGS